MNRTMSNIGYQKHYNPQIGNRLNAELKWPTVEKPQKYVETANAKCLYTIFGY